MESEKNKGGRPKKEFNKELFESLCEIQCTQTEIASVMKLDFKTLQRMCERDYGDSFANVYKAKTENGKTSLRRYQWNLAKTNSAMAIFLGKQYLGQKDRETDEVEQNKMVENASDILIAIKDKADENN